MSEELTVKSLRDRVSKSALPPDVKSDLLVQLRYAATPEQLAAIEARLTAEAPAAPAVKAPRESTAPIRSGKYGVGVSADPTYRAQPYSAPPVEAEYAEPPPELDAWQIIELLMDERDAFAADKPSQRRPFTKAAFREVVREVQAGPSGRTKRPLVERVEALDTTLGAYAEERYAEHPQVSDENKALFAAAVAELHDQVTRYLSAAQRYVTVVGGPQVKTAPSSRAVLSEQDPRLLATEQARKKQPTAPSPFAKQAKPLRRARRSDVVRSVSEKGRLTPVLKARGTVANARFAAVLVRFAPYGLYPQSKGRRKRSGPMPQRMSITAAPALVDRGRAVLDRYADAVDGYFERRFREARSPQGRYQLERGKNRTLDRIATARRDLDKAAEIADEVARLYAENPANPVYRKPFEKVQAIVDRVVRDYGTPLGIDETEQRNNGDDFDTDFEDETQYEGVPAWLFEAVFQRYMFMYPLEFGDAKDLIYKHRNAFVATQAKFLRRPVTPDVNIHGHFIIDMDRLFHSGSATLAQNAVALIDHAFMADVPGKGYTFLHKARESALLEAEKFAKEVESRQVSESMWGDAATAVLMFIDAVRFVHGSEEGTIERLARLEPRRDTRTGAANVGYTFFDALADAKRLERVRRTGKREPRPASDPAAEEILAEVLAQFGDVPPQFGLLVREQLAATLTEYRRKAKEARAATAAERDAAAKTAQSDAAAAAAKVDADNRGIRALELALGMVTKFGAEPFITRDWAGTQPVSYAKIKFDEKLKATREKAEPIRKFLLEAAPKAVESKHSTTPVTLLQDTVVDLFKKIRAEFAPSAAATTPAKLTKELTKYVKGLEPAYVPVVNAIRKNADEPDVSGEADAPPVESVDESTVDTSEPFADIPDEEPEQITWSSVVTVEPPTDRPIYTTDYFIKDWLNSNHNFFGVAFDFVDQYFDYYDEGASAPEAADDVFPVFGPHNIVTIAQYYRQYGLAPKGDKGVTAKYLGPTNFDDLAELIEDIPFDDDGKASGPNTRPRGFILRVDYDNDVNSARMATADGRSAARVDARALRNAVSDNPDDDADPAFLDEVFKVQFIWPFASEPLTMTADGFEEGAYDDTFGVMLAAFLWRQFDEDYQSSDSVLQTVRADLNTRLSTLEATYEPVAPLIEASIGEMYKMTGRIAALATWSQSTFINLLDGWLDDLEENPDKKEPWWLPYLVPNYEEILGEPKPLAAFKNIDFEKRRDEVSAAWRKRHDLLSDGLAPLGRSVGFMHVPTASVGGRTGARVAVEADLEKQQVRWGRDVNLREMTAEEYAEQGLAKDVVERIQAVDQKPTFFTRFSVVSDTGEAATFTPSVTRVSAKRTPYLMFDKVIQHYETMRDQIAQRRKQYMATYGTPQALRKSVVQDPEYIQPRWDVDANVKQAVEKAFRAGGAQASFAGLSINDRAMRASTIISFLSTALTATDEERQKNQFLKYNIALQDPGDDLGVAINAIVQNEIEPLLRTIHGDDPDAAIGAMEDLYALAEQHPNNAVYHAALDWFGIDSNTNSPVRGGRKLPSEATEDEDEDEEEVDVETVEEVEEPRENRQRRRHTTPRPNRDSKPLPVLSANEQQLVEQLRQGPALLIRQGVVLHMDNYGQNATADNLRDAFRKVVALLARKGHIDTSEGRPVLTDKGRRAEVDLIRQMLKQKKLLRSIVQGYDKYVRLVTARANMQRRITQQIRQVARQVPPPAPPMRLARDNARDNQRDNPSGFALSGTVKTRRMFDPRLGQEVETPVVEYRPQVFQDPPTFKKGSRQHQNRQRTQPPYRPRIYLPIDPDHPTTQAFFEDTSRPTHDTIRKTLDWSTREHAPGTNVDTYAPDELIPMGRKYRGAGPRGAVVKPKPVLTQAEQAKEAARQRKEVETARKTLEQNQKLVEAARERIAKGKNMTAKQQAAYEAFMGVAFEPEAAAAPAPGASMEEELAQLRAQRAQEDAQLRVDVERQRVEKAEQAKAAKTPKPAPAPAKPSAPPADTDAPRRRRRVEAPSSSATEPVDVPAGAYYVSPDVASGKAKLLSNNLDIELGLAMTAREQGKEDTYKQDVAQTRAKYAAIPDPRNTNLARTRAIQALLNVAEGDVPTFDVLKAYASPQTVERLNTLPPEAVQIAAAALAKLLRSLVSRTNGAKVAPDHNDGSSAYGPRFQGFRVR